MLPIVHRSPRFTRRYLLTQTTRCERIKKYIMDDCCSDGGFVCTFGRDLLIPRISDEKVPAKLLVSELPDRRQDQLDAVYTAIFELLTGSMVALLFVEPNEIDLCSDFDNEIPDHHETAKNNAISFHRLLYVASECTFWRDEAIDVILKRLERIIDIQDNSGKALVNLTQFAPVTSIGPLIQSTMAPTFPRHHPRYAPVTVHAVVPERLFRSVANNKVLINSIGSSVVDRASIPYESSHVYPIPNSMEYASRSFRDVLSVLTDLVAIKNFPDNVPLDNHQIARMVLRHFYQERSSKPGDSVEKVVAALLDLGFDARSIQ